MMAPTMSGETRLERLMERCNDLQVGVLHPHAFASHLQHSPDDLKLFNSVLPLLLASDRFELSTPLAQILQTLQRSETAIATTAICKAATLAEASFLYSLHIDYIPSSLRRIKANTTYLSQTLGWPHMMTVSVLQTCLNCNPTFASAAESSLPSTDILLPSCHVTEFDDWLSIFNRDLISAVAGVMHNVDTFVQHQFDENVCSKIQTFNEEQRERLAARLTLTFGVGWEEKSVSMPAQKRHVLLFLLTQYALSRDKQTNWHIVSIAYAYLFRQCDIENDTRVWWSSLLVVITDLYNTQLVAQSRAMLVIPFLFIPRVPADNLMIELLHLLSASGDDLAVYAALSLFKRLQHYLTDIDITIQCLASCLLLPEPTFQRVVDSLDPFRHQAFSEIDRKSRTGRSSPKEIERGW